MSSPSIAIVGAGPAGLTLALLLHRRDIPSTVFEYRPKPTLEELSEPCGVLDLHDESGQAALIEAGLYDSFLKLTGECSEAQRVADMHGTILYADEGELSSRPEISRHALTQLLLSHLPPNTIKWSHKLLSATPSPSPTGTTTFTTTLDFGPHGTHTFDFVAGADGAWSKLRPLLTPTAPTTTPHYAGQHNITLTLRHITTRFPALAAFVGSGSFSALGGHGHGVMSQRGPGDSARIYVFLSCAEDFASSSGLDVMTPSQAAETLLADETLLGAWGDRVKDLVRAACADEERARPGGRVDVKGLYTLPVGHRWAHRAGVTLLGDAAHLMPPWAGEGVNLGMWDALDLSRALAGAVEVWSGDGSFQDVASSFVRGYEEGMFPRVKEKAEETRANGEMLFGEDAARTFVRFFERAYGEREVSVEVEES